MCDCNKNTASSTGRTYSPLNNTQPANCTITPEMLQNWLAKLNCIKLNNRYLSIGLSAADMNRLLGTVQSAINWQSNYCYFEYQLQEVLLLMPTITSLPECS